MGSPGAPPVYRHLLVSAGITRWGTAVDCGGSEAVLISLLLHFSGGYTAKKKCDSSVEIIIELIERFSGGFNPIRLTLNCSFNLNNLTVK